MNIDKYGRTVVTSAEAFEFLYSGKINNFNELFIEEEESVEKFNSSIKQNADSIPKIEQYLPIDISLDMFDKENQKQWFMPRDAVHENLVEMLYGMCSTEEQTNRVSEELELFSQHGMIDLLFYLKYLVDTMRENNIVWGVGRGSSVASYVLYLIGIHKIDSIKYELDIKEFLK